MKLTETKGKLFIIGDAEDKTDDCVILKEFIKLAGGAKAKMVMRAETDHLAESAKEMIEVFKKFDAKDVNAVNVSNRQTEKTKNLELIEKASAIYFTGDQFHVTSLMGATSLQRKKMEHFA